MEDRFGLFTVKPNNTVVEALEKIDEMEASEVKRYLKELIKDNMIVGMEIIKS